MSVEVLTMGRVGVDLYPEQIGVRLGDVRTFRKMLGGSATNVAVAAARLGRRSAVITKVGDDPFGSYVRRALAEFGVDPARVSTHDTLRTPVVFCEIFPPDDFPLLFYREPKAPDMELTPADLDLGEIGAVPLFWMTGTGLSDEPSRAATLEALGVRGRRPITIFDLDYRSMFWRENARDLYARASAFATVLVGNRDEWSVLGGAPEDAARRAIESGADLAIVKMGPRGVLGLTSGDSVVVPPIEVEVVNGLGAGDAFGGALCHALLSRWDLERTLRFANAAGALVASRLGCADDMPAADEVEELLSAA